MSHRLRLTLMGAVLVLSALKPSAALPATSPAAGDPPLKVVRGTLLTDAPVLQSGEALLELSVGCGHAMRTFSVTATPETQVNGKKAEAGLPELQGHPVIEVRYRISTGRNLALTIELPRPGEAP